MAAGVNITTTSDGTREVRCAGPHETLRFPGKQCCAPVVTYRDGAFAFKCHRGHMTIISVDVLMNLLKSETPTG